MSPCGMNHCLATACYRILSAALGAAAGLAYGEHWKVLEIAAMKAKWGRVCGTWLEQRLWFWIILGAV